MPGNFTFMAAEIRASAQKQTNLTGSAMVRRAIVAVTTMAPSKSTQAR